MLNRTGFQLNLRNKMKKQKNIEFLYNSIIDSQSTIRAIDTKIGFLFAITFMPIAMAKELNSLYNRLILESFFHKTLVFSIFCLWVLLITYLFITLYFREKPKEETSLSDGFFFRIEKKQNETIDDITNKIINYSELDLIRELVYEKVNLTNILDKKKSSFRKCCCLFLTLLLLVSITIITLKVKL